MISHRYVPAICVLLLLALIPTMIHSYSPTPNDEGSIVDAIPTELGGYTSVRTDRNAGWGKRRFDSDNWVEREYRDPAGRANVRLTVVRTYDAKTAYHHPELAIAYGVAFQGDEIVSLPERPEIPVHVLQPGPGVSGSAAYVLHYGTRFVADPVAFQLRSAGEMLFRRRRPMTLFFASDPNATGDGVVKSPVTTVLFAAIDAFLKSGH